MKKETAINDLVIIALTLNKIKKDIKENAIQKEIDYITDQIEKIALGLRK